MQYRTIHAASLIASAAFSLVAQESVPLQEPATATLNATSLETASTTATLAGPAVVAYCFVCTGLTSSTGNLYFTRYSLNEFGPDSASFLRTGKTSLPGSEGNLYTESGDRPGFWSFGNVVWAFPGTYYGYFVANYNDFGTPTSYIKRAPLAGGTAVIMALSPQYIGARDLLTDGTHLYWVDAGGIRTMPVVGGAVTTLVTSAQVSRISLNASYLYYAEGTRISRVLNTGGAPSALFFAPDVVTALHASGGAQFAFLFWGEKNRAVRSRALNGTLTSTLQSPAAGRSVKSVGFDGVYALAIDCVEPGESTCNLKMFANIGTVTLSAGVGADRLQWDAHNVFWTDVNSVKRYSH